MYQVPDLPFMLLSALSLSQNDRVRIAKNATWQARRMKLKTFARYGVLETPEHLTFALKYEGVDLAALKRLF
jgi:hypothetical protein